MKNFEERLARLEELTQKIKSPDTLLSDAISQFEEGFKLAKGLEKDLEKLEKRVEILLNPSAIQASPEGSPAEFGLFDNLPE